MSLISDGSLNVRGSPEERGKSIVPGKFLNPIRIWSQQSIARMRSAGRIAAIALFSLAM